jgi:hypothetical protein
LISIRGAATSAKSTISPLSFSATSSDAGMADLLEPTVSG